MIPDRSVPSISKNRQNTTTPSTNSEIFGIAECIISSLIIPTNRLISYLLYTLYLLNIYDIIIKNNIIFMIPLVYTKETQQV